MNKELFDYPKQDGTGATCIAQAWAKVPRALPQEEKVQIIQKIKSELVKQDAVLVAHYYVMETSKTLPGKPVALLQTH